MTDIGQEVDYKGHAIRWIAEVLMVAVIGGFLNFILAAGIGGQGAVIFNLIISLGVALASGFLLFRHVDTLILKRLGQAQNSANRSARSN